MNLAAVLGSLLILLAVSGTAFLRAAPASPAPADTNITIDPAIAKASSEADADAADAPESPETPYAKALLNYKSGKYQAAQVLIDQADQEEPGNVPILMLKVRILSELKDFDGARKVLNSLYDRPDLTPAYASALALTTGDVALRQHHFDAATKAYETYLETRPNDADAKLKLIYARLSVGDMVTAGKYASELKPTDAATPAYYFARAAIARSSGVSDADQDIEQARTIYGITLTNRYLKTYLDVFSDKEPSAHAPSPTGKDSAPAGRAQ
jgi:tetratricopeptide (TPR) repeat protein